MSIGRLQPVIIILSAVAGTCLGAVVPWGGWSSLIEIFLMLMLYVLFLSVDLRAIAKSFSNVRFTTAALCLNFVFTPIVAWMLGVAFFPDSPQLAMGIMMLLVTPCTDWYLVFTGISRGNVELGISILPLNLILQVLLLPVYLMLFMGSRVDIDAASMIADVTVVLIVPFATSVVTKVLLGKRKAFERTVSERGDDAQVLFLCLAVLVMFASEGRALLDNLSLLLTVFVPLVIFFVLLLVVSQGVGRALRFPYADRTALTFTSLARNSPLSLAIAVAAFPDQPLVTLTLVIGPLIELPVLTMVSHLLLREAPDAEPNIRCPRSRPR